MTLYEIYDVLKKEGYLNNAEEFAGFFLSLRKRLNVSDFAPAGITFQNEFVYVNSRGGELIWASEAANIKDLKKLKDLPSLCCKKLLSSPTCLWSNIADFYRKKIPVSDKSRFRKRETLYRKLKGMCSSYIFDFLDSLEIFMEDAAYSRLIEEGRNDDVILLTYLLFLDSAGFFADEEFAADATTEYLKYILEGYCTLFGKDAEWVKQWKNCLMEESDKQIVFDKLHRLFLTLMLQGRIVCSQCRDIPYIHECVLLKYEDIRRQDGSRLLAAIHERRPYSEIFHSALPKNFIQNLDSGNRLIYEQIRETPAMNRCIKVMMIFPGHFVDREFLAELDPSDSLLENAAEELLQLGVLERNTADLVSGYRIRYAWSILMEAEMEARPLPLAFWAEDDFPVLGLLYRRGRTDLLYFCTELHRKWQSRQAMSSVRGSVGEELPYSELYRLTIYSILMLLKLGVGESLSEGQRNRLREELHASVMQISEDEKELKLSWMKRAGEADIRR